SLTPVPTLCSLLSYNLCFLFFFYCSRPHPPLPSFPTRRSSDLIYRTHISTTSSPRLTCRGDRRSTTTAIGRRIFRGATPGKSRRSEEHTSELQSRSDLVCRLLLEKKKKKKKKKHRENKKNKTI